MPRVRISAEAARELEEAAAWYERQSPGLGTRLIDAFESSITLLNGELPPLVPMPGTAGERGVKRLLLHRFPFSLALIDTNDEIVILALVHHSRRPRYWRDRLP